VFGYPSLPPGCGQRHRTRSCTLPGDLPQPESGRAQRTTRSHDAGRIGVPYWPGQETPDERPQHGGAERAWTGDTVGATDPYGLAEGSESPTPAASGRNDAQPDRPGSRCWPLA